MESYSPKNKVSIEDILGDSFWEQMEAVISDVNPPTVFSVLLPPTVFSVLMPRHRLLVAAENRTYPVGDHKILRGGSCEDLAVNNMEQKAKLERTIDV